MQSDSDIFRAQGFGGNLGVSGRLALVLVDFVNGFAEPDLFGGGNVNAAIARARALLAHARALGLPIAYSRIVFSDDSSDAGLFARKVPSLLKLTEQATASQIVTSLEPLAGELVVRKTVPSAFFGTGLGPWMVQRGIETLLVAGTTTSGCVRATVVDAMSWGFKPIVIKDCVGDRSLSAHATSLFEIAQKYADVMDLSDLVELIDSRREPPTLFLRG